MSTFDGIGFTGGILLVILVLLLIFGSTKIEDLTDAPK
jgi:Sec-independent protein translocase protein TatA